MERDRRLEVYMLMRVANLENPALVKDDFLYRIAAEGEDAITNIDRILTEREERRKKE